MARYQYFHGLVLFHLVFWLAALAGFAAAFAAWLGLDRTLERRGVPDWLLGRVSLLSAGLIVGGYLLLALYAYEYLASLFFPTLARWLRTHHFLLWHWLRGL